MRARSAKASSPNRAQRQADAAFYAPDLNPDELVWSHAKRTGNARRPLLRGERLEERVAAQLSDIGKRPGLVRSFFRHPSVAYISDC